MTIKNSLPYLLILCALITQAGCGKKFDVKQLGKGDIDLVVDTHRKEAERLLFELMDKLYKRNPRELAKQKVPDSAAQIARLQTATKANSALVIDGIEGVDLLKRAFAQDFTGDRVFVVVGGLLSMLHKSYGYHTEFFMFDTLDQQKLYNAARNIETFSWQLRMTKDDSNLPLLLSTELEGDDTNLSFERLIAKLISIQDMMALIAADGDTRAINGVAQGVAKFVFLPI